MASISWVGLPSSPLQQEHRAHLHAGLAAPAALQQKPKRALSPARCCTSRSRLGSSWWLWNTSTASASRWGRKHRQSLPPQSAGRTWPPGPTSSKERLSPWRAARRAPSSLGDARPRRGVGRVAGDAVQTPRREQRPKLPGVPLHNVHRGGKAVFLHRAPGLPGGLLLHLHPGDWPPPGCAPRHSRGITPQPVPKSAQRSLGRGAAKWASSTAVRAKGVLGTYQPRAPPQRGSHVVFCSRSSISRPPRQKSRARRGKAPAGLCSSEIVSFRARNRDQPSWERQPGKCRRKRRQSDAGIGVNHIVAVALGDSATGHSPAQAPQAMHSSLMT